MSLMDNAETETFFNESFDDLMTTLRRVNDSRDLDLEEKLIEFKNEKESHAKIFLNKIPGSIGRRGSVALKKITPVFLFIFMMAIRKIMNSSPIHTH